MLDDRELQALVRGLLALEFREAVREYLDTGCTGEAPVPAEYGLDDERDDDVAVLRFAQVLARSA